MRRALAVISLGCAKNLVDAEVGVGTLLAAGYELTPDAASADVIVVHTCAFIAAAREEARAVVAEVAAAKKPGAVLAVTGCGPQYAAAGAGAAFPEADVVLGVDAARDWAEAMGAARRGERVVRVGPAAPPVEGLGARPQLTAPHVAFLKIAEGCDHACRFCTVPRLRGPYRSRPPDDIIREADAAAARGVKELVLLAQDTSRWGADRGRGEKLAGLLRRLAATGVPWVRMMYLHPAGMTDELVGTAAELKPVVKYFDIPLQHVVPRVLRAMGRPAWRSDRLLARLERWRRLAPEAAFRTAFIAGYPGETAAEAAALADFITAARFDHVGVFEFSAEPGTPAVTLRGPVPRAEARARREALMLRQQEVVAAQYTALRGREVEVLVDRANAGPKGEAVGRTYAQAPEVDPVTFVAAAGPAAPGDFVRARVTGHRGYELVARAARAPAGARRA